MKKMLSLLLVLLMVFSAVMPTNTMGMEKDYLNHWAGETIQIFLDGGYINGYPDGTFRPDENITRAQFVTIINNLFGYTAVSAIKFTDVEPNAWYYEDVQKAYNAGYISGLSETQFAPDENLTREQAATVVSKIVNLEDNSQGIKKFIDNNEISVWAKDYVGSAAEVGIIKGYEDNTFKPQNFIKRAEAVVILNNALNQSKAADLTIDKAGTVIENASYRNIHITNDVGDGEVTLKNVTVTGELLVEGGGLNSIILDNSTINKLKANKSDGKVRILLTGDTVISNTTALSGVTLEQEGLTGKGFESVVIDKNANESQIITVKADIGTMTINAKIKINVKTGEIENIIIDKSAQDASINLADDVKVLLITVDAKVSFTGNGTIVGATINADEVSFEQKPENMTVKDGIKNPVINIPSIGGGGSPTPPAPEKLTLLNAGPAADSENAYLKWDYLTFVFNKNMAEVQTKEGIILKDENNNIVPIKDVVPGTTEKTNLLIIVDTELQLNTKYSIIVPENTVVGAAGEKYDKEISYSFKTVKNVIRGTLDTQNSYQGYNVYLAKGSEIIDTKQIVNYKQFFFTNILESGAYDIFVKDLENTIIFKGEFEIDNLSINEVFISPVVPVTSVTINDSVTNVIINDLEMIENEVIQVKAMISPLYATNQDVTWSSSNTTVAAISSDGIITAKTSGSAIITVITADGNKTATCEVTVNYGIPVDYQSNINMDGLYVYKEGKDYIFTLLYSYEEFSTVDGKIKTSFFNPPEGDILKISWLTNPERIVSDNQKIQYRVDSELLESVTDQISIKLFDRTVNNDNDINSWIFTSFYISDLNFNEIPEFD